MKYVFVAERINRTNDAIKYLSNRFDQYEEGIDSLLRSNVVILKNQRTIMKFLNGEKSE